VIKHAMSYVQRAEKVLEHHPSHGSGAELRLAKAMLVTAEQGLVNAYSQWRKAMRYAAEDGSELAARYLEESTWDLT
jgi:hypothetical protein